MTYIEQINEMISKNNGIVLTSDLTKNNIPRAYLSLLQKNQTIERLSRGLYISKNALEDEMFCLQIKNKRAIYSHETALFIHNLTDNIPYSYTVTVPSGYNASSLKKSGYKVFFVKVELYQLGAIKTKSPHNNNIRVFNIERTICDILRSRNRIDIQIINDAMKRYIKGNPINIKQLYNYARKFKIHNLVRQHVEFYL